MGLCNITPCRDLPRPIKLHPTKVSPTKIRPLKLFSLKEIMEKNYSDPFVFET
jgi:hypothetical protein